MNAFMPYALKPLTPGQAADQGRAFLDTMARRRSVRHFSKANVERSLIELAIETANQAPSGAHLQPWTFVCVSRMDLKEAIRAAAEEEERKTYEQRMSDEWREALAPLGTSWEKPHLTEAPWLVICFAQSYGIGPDGRKRKHYYVQESCGLACGFLICALHQMGLATLTHTPNPMQFLKDLLHRPDNEKPFILFPVGYPADDCQVPCLERKPLGAISEFLE